MKTPKMQLN